MAQPEKSTAPTTSRPPSPAPLAPPLPPTPLDAAASFAHAISSLGSFPFDSNPSTPTRALTTRPPTPPTPARSPTPTPPTRILSPPPSPSKLPARSQTEPPLNYAAAVTGLGRSSVARSATAPSEQDGKSGSGSGKAQTTGTGRKSLGTGLVGSTASEGEGMRKVPLVLEKYTLYETKTKFYVIASNQADSRYRVLKIDRSSPPPPATVPPIETEHDDDEGTDGLHVTEDATIYSKEEIRELLETLSAGNVGGVTRVEPLFYGIAGFVRFTSTYYMILIKSRAPVALVGGHYIYHCEETFLKPVTPLTGTKNADEARLMAAFLGVDLSKNFYFSYTYNVTHTLQHNLTLPIHDPSSPPPPTTAFSSFNDMWVWNRHLLKPAFRGLQRKSPWVLPLIHGFVDQAKLSVFGRTVYVTLIARRSRHFAGARFLKRGVNNQGYVANDVETEQIVSEALTTPFYAPAKGGTRKANPRYTSFVQVRGSIPLYWSQESINMSPKPPIELTIVDPFFSAAALHFDDLLGRYGGPITVLNLIKHKERAPRESKLLPEFKQCIDYLNQFLPPENTIKYIPWDISAANKQRDKDVIGILEDIAEESLESTNFFHSGPEPTWYALNPEADAPSYRSTPLLQSGVIRTNCIDCLDRTNAAQFVVAKAALGHQLHALGIIHHPRLPFDSDAVNLITEMFHDHGDTVALQYGGSHLVNTMETYRKIGAWTSHSRDMIENLRRYYANSFVDADKQAAIDLFLGIEPSSPLPTLPSPSNPRRSYREWFTRSHVDSSLAPAEAQKRLAKNVEGDDSYWQSYYRPKLFTEMARHFAFKVNSTDKYNPTGASGEVIDHSPFVPRLAAPHAGPRLNVGGVRRWMTHRGNNKTTLSARIQSQRIDETAPPDLPAPTTTEAIIARLLSPTVDADEEREYASYIQQFEELSLSQDLSEKDDALYRRNAAMASGEAEGEVRLGVDRASLASYVEAVRTGKAGQELRGSLETEAREIV